MAGVANFRTCGCPQKPLLAAERGSGLSSVGSVGRRSTVRILRPFEDEAFCVGRLAPGHLKKASLKVARPRSCIHMALVDERHALGRDVAKPSGILAYDLVQGALVRWSSVMDKSIPDPPTAVLLHGILGSRKNWGSFARRLAQEFPMWQVARLRVTPRVLVGHSFGGKVALSMVEQAAKPLARPVKVWVLDATPGKVRPGGDGEDHPAELIAFLSTMPKQVSSKREVVRALIQEGFSKDVAQWVVTNLRQTGPSSSFSWGFDLKGIAEMYKSYEETNLWKIVEDVPRGVHVNFLKAERSLHRWALEDLQRIHAAEQLAADEGAGVQMHVLEDAGHWVHADNPDGLFRILSSSFQGFKS
ncbi:uncharacterized protein LOC131242778 isoform X2 [Magnolia sinica]|uniref:uncharacterized protein LOC131242778 isoform X2 n=1 Tax=Magnolia sinica TaxID=86752 RepID=UPI00265B19F4|nr:uncharacterized protein LOC131242778 isoform X2 [Magnolia sinica]